MDILQLLGLRESPRPAPPVAPVLSRPSPLRDLVKREVFVGLAEASPPGAVVRNDGAFDPDMKVVAAGVLTYFEHTVEDGATECTRAYFTYADKYQGLALDPVNLDYHATGSRRFEVPPSLSDAGLFRVFSGCVPGQHGRHSLNRAHPETKRLNDLQLLHWLASGGPRKVHGFTGGFTSGALVFFTQSPGDERPMLAIPQVEALRMKTVRDLAGLAVTMTEQELTASIVHGGARPKTTYFDATGEVGKPGTHYIVKFNSVKDANNNARVEHGTLTLGQMAGVNVARTVVVRVLSDGKPVTDMFLTERFDRFTDEAGRDTRQHRLSLLSLMDPRKVRSQDAGDYHDIFEALRKVSADPESDCTEMFRRMLFNIAINNTDDHLKNHEMVCTQPGSLWRLSPAFDVAPNKNPYPHATSMAGFQHGTLKDDFVLKVAQRLGVTPDQAILIRNEVASAVSKWATAYESAGCGPKDLAYVQAALDQQGKRAETVLGFGKGLPDPLELARSQAAPGVLEALRAVPQINIEVTAPNRVPGRPP